jgi:membrane-bound lytic murein transglycosylase A
MKNKLLYIILISVVLLIGFLLWTSKPHKLGIRKASFAQLPGWKTTNTKKSFLAFQTSCKAFMKQNPEKLVGSDYVDLQVKDWLPACNAAIAVNTDSKAETQLFFQKWFTPVEFFDNRPVQGLFTGYYMPLLQGSLTKTDEYNVPLYGLPKKLVTADLELFDTKLKNRKIRGRVQNNKLLPFYTREEINKGMIAKFTPVIVWLNSSIDRSFLEIQGSGIIKLRDGSQLVVGYAGENGAAYTAIAKVLIDQGVMTRDNASMQHIRRYLEAHPEQIDRVLNQNKSFVFFEILRNKAALGTQGVPLTPGYSLAIDRKWVPLGAPVWLNTTRPDHKSNHQKIFQRLMVAQDTGGAIKGVVRGDVYWGAGERATNIAGKMKNQGHYWVLLPTPALVRLEDKLA